MRKIHLVVGIVGVVVFLLTGQYMDRALDHLRGVEDRPRFLYRASHIYILLSAIVNLALGTSWRPRQQALGRWGQGLASLLVIAAPFLLMIGFFTEPRMDTLTRLWTSFALYGLFGAGVLLAMLGLRRDER